MYSDIINSAEHCPKAVGKFINAHFVIEALRSKKLCHLLNVNHRWPQVSNYKELAIVAFDRYGKSKVFSV